MFLNAPIVRIAVGNQPRVAESPGRRSYGAGAASSANASSARRAVASQVNQRARARAPFDSRLRNTSSPRTRPSAPARVVQVLHQQARLTVEDGVGVAGDRRGHGRSAAGGGLGQCHAPPLPLRAAGHDPGPAIPLHQFGVVHPAGQVDPIGRPEFVTQGLEGGPFVSLADDHRPQVGEVRLQRGQRPEQRVEALDGDQSAHGHDQRRGQALATRRVTLVDPGRRHRHPVRPEPQQLHDLVA